MLRKNGRNLQGKSLTQSEKSPTSKLRCRWGYVKLYSVGVQAPTELKRSAGCARIRIGSESAKADPNPARKTRERVLTGKRNYQHYFIM